MPKENETQNKPPKYNLKCLMLCFSNRFFCFLLTNKWHTRKSDDVGSYCKGVTTAEFKEAYEDRSKYTLSQSRVTNIVKTLAFENKKMLERMSSGTEPLEDYGLVINSHPYNLTLEEEILSKKPYELSGGQLQRCSILRALLMKPDLLLVDEPTSALDNIIAYDVMKLLITLLDKCAILLITHDLDMASWCSDKIIRLEENARK